MRNTDQRCITQVYTITEPGITEEKLDTLIDRNHYSMLHIAVVLEMVKTCKNKKSLYFNDIDKSVVKKALKAILRFNL